jgi:hypothetical protein
MVPIAALDTFFSPGVTMITTSLLLIATLGAWPDRGMTSQFPATGCAPLIARSDTLSEWSFRQTIRDYVKFDPSDNGLHVQFVRADTLGIRSVHVDSLCDRAVALLHRFLVDSAFWPVGVRLARAGRYYIVQDTGTPGSHNEFQNYLFVLDEKLTRVLFPCSSGYSDCFGK